MQFMCQEELAKYCDVSRQTIRRWQDSGKIPKPLISHAGRHLWTISQAVEIKTLAIVLIRSVPSEINDSTQGDN
jgi:DNA-binding transcriptional MerR regulator